MKKQKILIPLLLILAIAAFFLFSKPAETQESLGQKIHKAEVTSVINQETIQVEFTEGELAGQSITIINDESLEASPRIFQVGDDVLVTHNFADDSYYISDFIRTNAILVLFVIFVIATLLIAGWQGIGALIGMALSFIVLFQFILPQILSGQPPVLTAIIGSAAIIPLTFYSSHGISRKTTVAVVGTLITLIIAGILSTFFANFANLTGLASEEILYLSLDAANQIDFQGLVLAGMIISILGVLDDITISQASVVQQLKGSKKKISRTELFTRAMTVGRDHIASLVNTLILVYTGASLPLLLLFIDASESFTTIINLEFMAEEIVRTLIGSIGLILAVPITTALAVFTIKKAKKGEKVYTCSHSHH